MRRPATRTVIWITGGIVAVVAVAIFAAQSRSPSDSSGTSASADADPTATPTTAEPTEASGVEPTATSVPSVAFAVDQIPGDPREGVASALRDRYDDTFPEPLVDPGRIRAGGPPPDGIPPLDDPRFERVPEVSWLEDVEPVLAVEIGGEARAYPIQIMTWHEIVNDTYGTMPVTVSYCPLCNSAIVYVRRAAGRTLDFGTSGMLYNSALVMYDRQTESLWSHFTAEAVVGFLTGTRLETLPAATVSWHDFREAHPDGLVLSRETGHVRSYGRNPYPGYDDVNRSPFAFDGETDGRLPAQQRVIAIRGETESLAVVLDDLAEVGVLETTLDGEPVVLLHQPGTSSALDSGSIAGGRDIGAVGVFDPRVDGRRLQLSRLPAGGFVDSASGAVFDVLGHESGAGGSGQRLEPIEHLDTFWFAIAAFEPETRIVEL